MVDKRGHSKQNSQRGVQKKRIVSGKTQADGDIRAHLTPDTKNQDTVSAKKADVRENVKFWIEGLSLLVLIIYAGLTAWQVYETRLAVDEATRTTNTAVASYEATVRPYVFVLPKVILTKEPRPILNFNAIFKNFGTIPAQNVSVGWKVISGGVVRDGGKRVSDRPSVLPPGEVTYLVGSLGYDETPAVISGSETLIIYAEYKYHWRDKEEVGCEKFQYYPPAEHFFDLGPTCYPY